MSAPFQLFDALDAATESALRASIERFGVLVPVTRDQHGNILDGHHRARIADELGVGIADDVVIHVKDDDEAREIARTLNTDRRHLTEEQRRPVAVELRQQGHSYRAIGGALGVSHTQARKDVEAAQLESGFQLEQPDRVKGLDGKERPAARPTPKPAPEPPSDADLLAGADWPTGPLEPAGQERADGIVSAIDRANQPPDDEQLLAAIEKRKPGATAEVNRTRVRARWSRALAGLSDLPLQDAEQVSAVLSDSELNTAAGVLDDAQRWLAKVRTARSGLRIIQGGTR